MYELCGFERVSDVDARCWDIEDDVRVLDSDCDVKNRIWDCGRVRWERTV